MKYGSCTLQICTTGVLIAEKVRMLLPPLTLGVMTTAHFSGGLSSLFIIRARTARRLPSGRVL